MAKLILASSSPRRSELLKQLGLQFQILVSHIDENAEISNLSPEKYAEDLSFKKAFSVSNKIDSGVILAADTIVVYKGQILGKPQNKVDAKKMLEMLSGNVHDVITGITLFDVGSKKQITTHDRTKVYFKTLSQQVIDGYIATEEPYDKAGAYGIQGLGASLVDKIEGCYFNVVGLPISKLVDLLPEFNIEIFRS